MLRKQLSDVIVSIFSRHGLYKKSVNYLFIFTSELAKYLSKLFINVSFNYSAILK